MFMSVLGEHPWVIRLPAILFGVATIPALYFLACRVASRREALFGAALLTVSYHHVWFSQNARGYTAIALSAILCSHLFLSLLENRRNRDIGLYAVIAALGCYAHLTMVFIVVAHFLVLAVWLLFKGKQVRQEDWIGPMAAFVLSAVFTLLLYAPILPQVIDYFVNQSSGMQNLSTHSWALSEAFRSLSSGFGSAFVVIGGLAMLLVGAASFFHSNKVILGIFAASILVTFLVAFFARGTMYPRFFFFLLGFFILFGVRGVFATAGLFSSLLFGPENRSRYGALFGALAMMLVITVSAFSMLRNYQYPKMDFEGAKDWVESHASDEDVIVTTGVAAWAYANYYQVEWPEMKVAADVERAAQDARHTWIVFSFGRYLKESAPEVYEIVDGGCESEKRFPGTLGGGDVVVCQLPSAAKRIL